MDIVTTRSLPAESALSRPTVSIPYSQLGIGRQRVAALLEVDVTRARSGLRTRNRGAASAVSLLAWLAKCIAASLAGHPKVARSAHVGSSVSLVVEREIEGIRLPIPVSVTSADSRCLAEIEAAINYARTGALDLRAILRGALGNRLVPVVYSILPKVVRRSVLKRVLQKPRRTNRMSSVTVASVGMGGRVKGWFVPHTAHPICIGVGAVAPKATVLNGTIQAREVLHLAVLIDHGVVAGAPASQWISDLVRALEQGKELGDWQN